MRNASALSRLVAPMIAVGVLLAGCGQAASPPAPGTGTAGARARRRRPLAPRPGSGAGGGRLPQASAA